MEQNIAIKLHNLENKYKIEEAAPAEGEATAVTTVGDANGTGGVATIWIE